MRGWTRAGGAFADRADAGRRLAEQLEKRAPADPVVIGLARGGVPVAAEIADRLSAPLDVAVARKIGVPGHSEYGVGAVTATGPAFYHEKALAMLGLTSAELKPVRDAERAEARRRISLYRKACPPIPVHDKDVILIDDGLATGVTATAALRAVREHQPRSITFAAPVCAPDAAEALAREADAVVSVLEPADFDSVGKWYRDFRQTSDDEVIRLLGR